MKRLLLHFSIYRELLSKFTTLHSGSNKARLWKIAISKVWKYSIRTSPCQFFLFAI